MIKKGKILLDKAWALIIKKEALPNKAKIIDERVTLSDKV